MDIKAYKPESNSVGSGQILHCLYTAEKAHLVMREMADLLSLDLVEKGLVTDQIVLTVGYDADWRPQGMSDKYEDIINLPHHTSDRHARMSMLDRAAQFSPFAALTGYDAAVKETARLTDSRIELTEEEKAILDAKLREAVESGEAVRITYFVSDGKKAGGSYVDVLGQVKKLVVLRV